MALELRVTLESKINKLKIQETQILNAKIDKALEVNNQLIRMDMAIKDEAIKLGQQYEFLQRSLESLQLKCTETNDALNEVTSRPVVDVAQILVCANSNQSQLLECLAEDQAIDDCLYALGVAFKKEKFDFATYMRSVRNYSNEQYYKRARALKIQRVLATG